MTMLILPAAILLLASLPPATGLVPSANSHNVHTFPNPRREKDRDKCRPDGLPPGQPLFLCDPDGLLSPGQRAQLNALAVHLQEDTRAAQLALAPDSVLPRECASGIHLGVALVARELLNPRLDGQLMNPGPKDPPARVLWRNWALGPPSSVCPSNALMLVLIANQRNSAQLSVWAESNLPVAVAELDFLIARQAPLLARRQFSAALCNVVRGVQLIAEHRIALFGSPQRASVPLFPSPPWLAVLLFFLLALCLVELVRLSLRPLCHRRLDGLTRAGRQRPPELDNGELLTELGSPDGRSRERQKGEGEGIREPRPGRITFADGGQPRPSQVAEEQC